MQQSGGLLLAAGLDGGNTLIKSNPSILSGFWCRLRAAVFIGGDGRRDLNRLKCKAPGESCSPGRAPATP